MAHCWLSRLICYQRKILSRTNMPMSKTLWHLIKVVELFRWFNDHQIPHIDFGSGAHKAIAILRSPTHRKRVLNGRHQNSIYIECVWAKTLYTLPGANQNSIHIAGLGLETLYTLSLPEQKLYIHWPVFEPKWHREKCLKIQHRKKKWHWFTAGFTEVVF
jgi:hypothetical protein